MRIVPLSFGPLFSRLFFVGLFLLPRVELFSEDLARLGITPFQDQTDRGGELKWLVDSLPAAIDTSLKKNFEYEAVSPDTMAEIYQEETGDQGGLSKKNLSRLARECACDLVIYGRFETKKTSRNRDILRIYAGIYNQEDGSQISQIERQAPVNNKLFRVTEDIARQIVKDLREYALKTRKKAKGAPGKKDGETEPSVADKLARAGDKTQKINLTTEGKIMSWLSGLFQGSPLYSVRAVGYFPGGRSSFYFYPSPGLEVSGAKRFLTRTLFLTGTIGYQYQPGRSDSETDYFQHWTLEAGLAWRVLYWGEYKLLLEARAGTLMGQISGNTKAFVSRPVYEALVVQRYRLGARSGLELALGTTAITDPDHLLVWDKLTVGYYFRY